MAPISDFGTADAGGERVFVTKVFNTTAVCIPGVHYMVNIEERLLKIKELVDDGKYFTINRARQYGKTTTLMALEKFLRKEYSVVFIDFQMFDDAKFKDGHTFAVSFAQSFLRIFKKNKEDMNAELREALDEMKENSASQNENFTLKELFENLSEICETSARPVVLIIDEVDSATNNQVFLDFLSQLRAYYIGRMIQPTFHSVILAGVYDVKNLKRKLRADDDHKVNSPWNIAADFNIDMSFSQTDIAGMLEDYESDHHTGMDIEDMSGLLYDYTSGYPFLVSRLCKLMDEEPGQGSWTKSGFNDAVRLLLSEKNTLFESLSEKLISYPELNTMLQALLFTGKSFTYNNYEPAVDMATMFGFIKNEKGVIAVANRIFDTWLYNFYLSASQLQNQDIYKVSLQDKSQFIAGGRLNMRLILEKFVVHFNDLYGDSDRTFIEDEGRKYFLLYLRPIINGTGNYYIESRTRDLRRTDVIVDYHGEQYVIEMKIWHGEEYNNRGEQQLVGYLNDYHTNKGYMISFNFNKNKQIGVRELVVGEKTLIEAIV